MSNLVSYSEPPDKGVVAIFTDFQTKEISGFAGRGGEAAQLALEAVELPICR